MHHACVLYSNAAPRFRQHIPSLQMTIYEKNEGVGGTWLTNKYP